MNSNCSTFISGLLFGLGLGLGLGLVMVMVMAQMTNPIKVLGFLDVAGNWNPTLALVMVGALLTLGILQWFMRKRLKQIQDTDRDLLVSPKANIDVKLIAGSVLFGIGWGLSGLCPGPALVSLMSGLASSYVFVGAMFTGFFVFNRLHRDR